MVRYLSLIVVALLLTGCKAKQIEDCLQGSWVAELNDGACGRQFAVWTFGRSTALFTLNTCGCDEQQSFLTATVTYRATPNYTRNGVELNNASGQTCTGPAEIEADFLPVECGGSFRFANALFTKVD